MLNRLQSIWRRDYELVGNGRHPLSRDRVAAAINPQGWMQPPQRHHTVLGCSCHWVPLNPPFSRYLLMTDNSSPVSSCPPPAWSSGLRSATAISLPGSVLLWQDPTAPDHLKRLKKATSPEVVDVQCWWSSKRLRYWLQNVPSQYHREVLHFWLLLQVDWILHSYYSLLEIKSSGEGCDSSSVPKSKEMLFW